MNIKYHDDNKEESQSHTFKAEGGNYLHDSNFEWDLFGYGSTKEEAEEETRRALKLLIADIEDCLETFEKD